MSKKYVTAITWLKYCWYSVNRYPINYTCDNYQKQTKVMLKREKVLIYIFAWLLFQISQTMYFFKTYSIIPYHDVHVAWKYVSQDFFLIPHCLVKLMEALSSTLQWFIETMTNKLSQEQSNFESFGWTLTITHI